MKITYDELFKYSYVISINKYRYNHMVKVFDHYNLPKPNLHIGFLTKQKDLPALGCTMSHVSLIMMAQTLKLPYVLIFEDDAYPCIDIVNKLKYYLDRIPDDCGILSFSYTGHSGAMTRYNSDFIQFETHPWGSQAYLVFQSAYAELLMSLGKHLVSDQALGSSNFKTIKPYWTREYLFCQQQIDNSSMSQRQIQNTTKLASSVTYLASDDIASSFTESSTPPPRFEHIVYQDIIDELNDIIRRIKQK